MVPAQYRATLSVKSASVKGELALTSMNQFTPFYWIVREATSETVKPMSKLDLKPLITGYQFTLVPQAAQE